MSQSESKVRRSSDSWRQFKRRLGRAEQAENRTDKHEGKLAELRVKRSEARDDLAGAKVDLRAHRSELLTDLREARRDSRDVRDSRATLKVADRAYQKTQLRLDTDERKLAGWNRELSSLEASTLDSSLKARLEARLQESIAGVQAAIEEGKRLLAALAPGVESAKGRLAADREELDRTKAEVSSDRGDLRDDHRDARRDRRILAESGTRIGRLKRQIPLDKQRERKAEKLLRRSVEHQTWHAATTSKPGTPTPGEPCTTPGPETATPGLDAEAPRQGTPEQESRP